MQFLEDPIKNKPNLSTLDTQSVASFSADYQISSTSTSSIIKPSSFSPLHNNYTDRLQNEKERFFKPSLPKKTNIWSSPWNDQEKLRPFQALLKEKVPEFDDFAKAKFAKRRDIISNVEDFGKALDNLSVNVMDRNGETICTTNFWVAS